jgi:hypothetical protein
VNYKSALIECEGLEQAINELQKKNVVIDGIVIDRNTTTVKMMKEKFSHIQIHHDWFHCAKSVCSSIYNTIFSFEKPF